MGLETFFRPTSIMVQADLISFGKSLSLLMFMRHAVHFFFQTHFLPAAAQIPFQWLFDYCQVSCPGLLVLLCEFYWTHSLLIQLRSDHYVSIRPTT